MSHSKREGRGTVFERYLKGNSVNKDGVMNVRKEKLTRRTKKLRTKRKKEKRNLRLTSWLSHIWFVLPLGNPLQGLSDSNENNVTSLSPRFDLRFQLLQSLPSSH
jgi:hypothetical protein